MTLYQFLSTLKTNNILVTIKDLADNEIAKAYASSYGALDDELVTRTVARWNVNGATAIAVVLNDAVISA